MATALGGRLDPTSALQTLPLEVLCQGVLTSLRGHPLGAAFNAVLLQSCEGKEERERVSKSFFGFAVLRPWNATISPAKHVLSSFPLQNSNGIYTGFIKVQMELCKPPQTSPNPGKLAPGSNGCMNTLHISSTNTVGEVIEALLKKFLVTESPAKFALYKRCHREDQGTLPRLKLKCALL